MHVGRSWHTYSQGKSTLTPKQTLAVTLLTPPCRLSSYDDGKENTAHPHMMICRLRRNACIKERCQKGKEDLSQASFKYTHFAVAGKSSYEDERRSLHHHHMMTSDAEGLNSKPPSVMSSLRILVQPADDYLNG